MQAALVRRDAACRCSNFLDPSRLVNLEDKQVVQQAREERPWQYGVCNTFMPDQTRLDDQRLSAHHNAVRLAFCTHGRGAETTSGIDARSVCAVRVRGDARASCVSLMASWACPRAASPCHRRSVSLASRVRPAQNRSQ